MKRRDNKGKCVLEGVIVPLEERNQYSGTLLSIVTRDDDYYVSASGTGKLLVDYIGEEVKVEGKILCDDDGLMKIIVQRFKPLDSGLGNYSTDPGSDDMDDDYLEDYNCQGFYNFELEDYEFDN